MYEIEKSVPLAEVERGSGRPALYPFAVMEVGDSFFVPRVSVIGMSRRVHYWQKKLNAKFACRTVAGGCRVWRTE